MSIPDHGEFDIVATDRIKTMVRLATTFLEFYIETDELEHFDAALTILQKAYQRAITPATGLRAEIEAASTVHHELTFRDVAQPGPVVSVPLIRVIPPALEEEPE